jgi:putative membrane protein
MMFGNGFNGIGNCFGYGLMRGGGGMIIMLAVTALIVAGIVFFARRKTRRNTDNAALDALKMRFARGEITDEEYLKRKTILE